MGHRHRAPRGAVEPSGGGRPSPPCRRSGAVKLGAARSPGREKGRQAAPTTTRRASTARWSGLGKRDGTVYVRNQRLNASQAHPPAPTWRMWAGQRSVPAVMSRRGTPGAGRIAARETTVKVCGVVVAGPQGHSWAPRPSSGSTVNVGTHRAVPDPRRVQRRGGKARRRLMPPGGGGGPVVVRGRESRPHGEGVQRIRSGQRIAGGRW